MPDQTPAYRVLARKYRPANFSELVGQDALVRTLKNAIDTGRIAHAFMLTGVRGVGKTTTARIIAKALNYAGPDGTAGPTTGPTDDCAICRSIADGNHPDVMEMDAATRNGVEDVREILDGVRYAPVSARYKIYIIDEVHMMSKGAFNALLKTLEEPPPHVKFIFATTEIGKVPVTVLSRCQRFDLRRVEIPVLEGHYAGIAMKEGVTIDPVALSMIARAADGSVRDGLSLLDQAIALGQNTIDVDLVKSMLGLADRGRVLDVLDAALRGDIAESLDGLADLHRLGADPVRVLHDLLDLTHVMTRLRVAPKTRDMSAGLSPDAMDRAFDLAGKMSMPTLGRAWQILLKGLAEVQVAPNPLAAAEMVLIRLVYAADLPDPADLLKKLKDGTIISAGGSPAAGAGGSSRQPEHVGLRIASSSGASVASAAPLPQTVPGTAPHAAVALHSLADIVTLLEQNREMMWASQIYQYAHLLGVQDGRLSLVLDSDAHPKLASELGSILTAIMGQRWVVSVSDAAFVSGPVPPTLAQQAEQDHAANAARAMQNPAVSEIMALFPGVNINIIQNAKDRS